MQITGDFKPGRLRLRFMDWKQTSPEEKEAGRVSGEILFDMRSITDGRKEKTKNKRQGGIKKGGTAP